MKIIFKPFLLSILFFQETQVTPANPEEKKSIGTYQSLLLTELVYFLTFFRDARYAIDTAKGV